MTKKELANVIKEYKEYKALMKETEAAVEALEKKMKAELERKNVNELEIGGSIIRYTPVISKRFNSKGFKEAEPELYEAWLQETESRRFSVA